MYLACHLSELGSLEGAKPVLPLPPASRSSAARLACVGMLTYIMRDRLEVGPGHEWFEPVCVCKRKGANKRPEGVPGPCIATLQKEVGLCWFPRRGEQFSDMHFFLLAGLKGFSTTITVETSFPFPFLFTF